MIIDNNCINNEYVNIYKKLSNRLIVLPIFQRGFSWKEEQTFKILEDIENIIDGNMYDSSQIYLLDFIWFEEDGMFKLADGQQRIVTLNILIKCLKDFAANNNKNLDIKNFNISYDDDKTNDKWNKFVDGSIDAPFKKVYLYLNEWVKKHNDNIDNIVEVLKNNIYIYLKKAKDADDAFDVFEQINTGGKPLSKDEIIKTIITQYSYKYSIKVPASKKGLKTMLTSYYKYSDDNTEGSFNNIAIMSFLNRKVVGCKNDFQKFADYINFAKNADNTSIYYVVDIINRTQLRDIIFIYEAQGKKIKDNRNVVDKILMPLCLQCIIWTLSGISPAGRVKGYLDHIVNMVKDKKSISDIQDYINKFTDDNKDICNIKLSDFKEKLVGKSKQNVLEALLLMDIIRCNTSGDFNPNLINLEHIYPQRPDTEWANNGWPVNLDEQHNLIYDIGNYLILNGEVNKKVKNKYISKKVSEYKRIIPKDRMLQTPLNTVDFVKFENESEYIKNRRYEIGQKIYELYPNAKVFIKP